jgi:hypothetical protein
MATAVLEPKIGKDPGDAGCMCGVPNCQGHEMINGEIHIPNHPKLGHVVIRNRPR